MTGIFLIAFMVVTAAMAFYYMPEVVKESENPTIDGLMRGSWAPGFEKTLNETLPASDPSKNFWGRSEYALFGQGRKGVVVGSDGWLFTDEEFECPKQAQERVKENFSYIEEVRTALKKKKIALAVILVPAKVRLYAEHLGDNKVPACRDGLYSLTMLHLKDKDIKAVDLLSAMAVSPDKESYFLKTDTHWTPEGARKAAQKAAETIAFSAETRKAYATQEGEKIKHDGDLKRYLPGVSEEDIAADYLQAYETQEQDSEDGEASAMSLFGDDIPPMTLVGTSYSANPAWNFLGFLKQAFGVDILDMSDEGRGPFTVMEKYLESDAIENTPPQMVIWEIPERYITSDPGMENKSSNNSHHAH